VVVTVLFLIKGYEVLWWYDAFRNTVNCCTVMEGKKVLPLSNICSKNGVRE
jgi:hypothetical protein